MEHLEEIRLVEKLGNAIGYGNLMSIASALWAKDLSNWLGKGIDMSDAALVPVVFSSVKDEYKYIIQKERERELDWVNRYYEEKGIRNDL